MAEGGFVASAAAAPSAPGVLLLAYLVLTVPALLAGGLAWPAPALLGAHLFVAAGVAALEARRGRRGRHAVERVAADWHLLLLLPALYAELPALMLGTGFHDGVVARIEEAFFAGQPAFAWAGAWPWAWVSEPLHAAYLSYYAVIYVPPLLLYLQAVRGEGVGTARHPRHAVEAFEETVAALGMAMLTCYLVFVVWPVQGPRYLAVPEGVPPGPVRTLVLAVLESGSSRGAAFPSSHVSVAVAQTWMALRFQPLVGGVLLVVTPLLAVGAVYGGFHYATDVVAGALAGVLAALAAGPLVARLRGRTDAARRGFTSPGDAA